MKIIVNGTNQEFKEETVKLNDLLVNAGVAKPELVSVQLNGNFVSRENYSSTSVRNDDEVDFLFFMGGGSEIYSIAK